MRPGFNIPRILQYFNTNSIIIIIIILSGRGMGTARVPVIHNNYVRHTRTRRTGQTLEDDGTRTRRMCPERLE